MRCLLMYGWYLKTVVNEQQEADSIIEKADFINRSQNACKQ